MKKQMLFILFLVIINLFLSTNSRSLTSKYQNQIQRKENSKQEETLTLEVKKITGSQEDLASRKPQIGFPENKLGVMFSNCEADTENFVMSCFCIGPNSKIEGNVCRVSKNNDKAAARVKAEFETESNEKGSSSLLVDCQGTTKNFKSKCECRMGKVSKGNCVFSNEPLIDNDSQEYTELYKRMYEDRDSALNPTQNLKKSMERLPDAKNESKENSNRMNNDENSSVTTEKDQN